MLIPVNIAGGSYAHKSRPLLNQVTRNWWPQLQPSDKGRSKYILQGFYGLKLFSSTSGNADRGFLENQGKVYKITDTTLYSVNALGVHTALGTIPGSGRCFMKSLGSQIVIANGAGSVFCWDGSALSQNTSVNLGSPRSVSVINNQAVYDQGTGQTWVVSDAGQPSVIDGLNYAEAESFSDDLLMTYSWREMLYLVGKDTIEPLWNSGQGNPPFDKVQGGTLKVGSNAIYSFADNPDYLFFLGSDNQFHTISPGTSAVDTVVSDPTMSREIGKYLVTSDCIGWTMELEGQWFYVATFPSEDVTWVLPVGGEWFKWGTGDGRIRANGYVRAFGKHLVSEHNSGDIYELDDETYTDAGQPIIRTRDTAPLHSGLVGAAGKEFDINALEVILEVGVGIVSGQGSDPRIMVSVSRDGGKNFGTERMLRVGKRGELVKVRTGSFGRFKSECVFRVRASDPVRWAIYGLNVDMSVCL